MITMGSQNVVRRVKWFICMLDIKNVNLVETLQKTDTPQMKRNSL